MAEMTEAAHLDAREDREPVTPEVTGPVNVPELPPSGDVDVATINAASEENREMWHGSHSGLHQSGDVAWCKLLVRRMIRG